MSPRSRRHPIGHLLDSIEMSSISKVLTAIIVFGASVLSNAAQSAAPEQVAPADSVVGEDYIIGPGDTIQVYVWQNPELTITVPVRSDGKITTPLVEDMVAIGKSPTQLARDIEAVLSEYVRSPRVNVFVTQSAHAYSQVKVVGQVEHPQAIAYREGMTLLDAILQVGGLSRFAAGNRAKLVRTEEGKRTERTVRLGRLLNGDAREDVPLKPGDIIFVPESRF